MQKFWPSLLMQVCGLRGGPKRSSPHDQQGGQAHVNVACLAWPPASVEVKNVAPSPEGKVFGAGPVHRDGTASGSSNLARCDGAAAHGPSCIGERRRCSRGADGVGGRRVRVRQRPAHGTPQGKARQITACQSAAEIGAVLQRNATAPGDQGQGRLKPMVVRALGHSLPFRIPDVPKRYTDDPTFQVVLKPAGPARQRGSRRGTARPAASCSLPAVRRPAPTPSLALVRSRAPSARPQGRAEHAESSYHPQSGLTVDGCGAIGGADQHFAGVGHGGCVVQPAASKWRQCS